MSRTRETFQRPSYEAPEAHQGAAPRQGRGPGHTLDVDLLVARPQRDQGVEPPRIRGIRADPEPEGDARIERDRRAVARVRAARDVEQREGRARCGPPPRPRARPAARPPSPPARTGATRIAGADRRLCAPTNSAATAGTTVPPGRENATSIMPEGASVVPLIDAPALTPGSMRTGTGADGVGGASRTTAAAGCGAGGGCCTTSAVACVARRASQAAMITAAARARSAQGRPGSRGFSPMGSPEPRRNASTTELASSVSVATSGATSGSGAG